jgi:hypothetical protein
MVKHEIEEMEASKATLTCHWCERVFSNKYNCDRHKNNRCPYDPSKILQPATNVNPSAPNVNLDAPNVNQPAPNVNLDAPNVNQECETILVTNERNKKFPCPTCFRIFSRNSLLQRHIPSCDQTTTIFECSKCHAIFSSRQAKSKHMARCTDSFALTVPNNHGGNVTTANNSFNTTNIQTQINNNTQIIINGFGKEDISHLTSDFLAAQALKMHGDGVVKCIESVHFNPEYPQNHNLRLVTNPDVPKTAIAVYDNDQWLLRDYYNTMRVLIQHMSLMLKYRASQPDFREKHSDSWTTIYNRLQSLTSEQNPKDFYSVLRQVKLLLQNMEKVEV